MTDKYLIFLGLISSLPRPLSLGFQTNSKDQRLSKSSLEGYCYSDQQEDHSPLNPDSQWFGDILVLIIEFHHWPQYLQRKMRQFNAWDSIGIGYEDIQDNLRSFITRNEMKSKFINYYPYSSQIQLFRECDEIDSRSTIG